MKNKIQTVKSSKSISKLLFFPSPPLLSLPQYNDRNSTSDYVDFTSIERGLLDGTSSTNFKGIFGPLASLNEQHCRTLPYHEVRYYYYHHHHHYYYYHYYHHYYHHNNNNININININNNNNNNDISNNNNNNYHIIIIIIITNIVIIIIIIIMIIIIIKLYELLK